MEGIEIEEEALAHLGGVSEATSLRHAVQLLTPASTLAATHGRDGVNRADLEEVPPFLSDPAHNPISCRLATTCLSNGCHPSQWGLHSWSILGVGALFGVSGMP